MIENLTNFSGGFATDLQREEMDKTELLTGENCVWLNKLQMRLGIAEYADLSTYDDVLGAVRLYINSNWLTIVAVEASSAVKFYQGTSTSFAEITDPDSSAYTWTAAKEVHFTPDPINGVVVAVNSTDRPAAIYYDGSKYTVQDLDQYDTRTRRLTDWKAGQYTDSGTVYTNDTTDAQDSGSDDFQLASTTNNDGHYVTSDFPFTKISYTSANTDGSAVSKVQYWNGSAWTDIGSYNNQPSWSSGGNVNYEWELPLDSDGEMQWVLYTEGDEAEIDNKYAARVIFTTAPAAALHADSIAIAHTHFLTQMLKDEKPNFVTTHNNRCVLVSGNIVNYSPPFSVKNWNEYDIEYAERGGDKILAAFTHQEYLGLIKSGALYGLFGNSYNTWRFQHLQSIGIAAPRAWAIHNNILFFVAPDYQIWMWTGKGLVSVSKHIKTVLEAYTITDAAGGVWKGLVWFSFPTDGEVLVFDPDTFRQDESTGDGRVSFFKFTSAHSRGYRVDGFLRNDDGSSLHLGWQRGASDSLVRMDNANQDYGSQDIAMDFKTKEMTGEEYQAEKGWGRLKLNLDAAGNYTVTLTDDEGNTQAETMTSTTDYVSVGYELDGEWVTIRVQNTGSTRAGIQGISLASRNRRF